MDYQAKYKFMILALQVIIEYADSNPEIDSSRLRNAIFAKRKDLSLGGDCDFIHLSLDNGEYDMSDVSFGYSIKLNSLLFNYSRGGTDDNLWGAKPDFLFKQMRIQAKQEELIVSWFRVIQMEWAERMK